MPVTIDEVKFGTELKYPYDDVMCRVVEIETDSVIVRFDGGNRVRIAVKDYQFIQSYKYLYDPRTGDMLELSDKEKQKRQPKLCDVQSKYRY